VAIGGAMAFVPEHAIACENGLLLQDLRQKLVSSGPQLGEDHRRRAPAYKKLNSQDQKLVPSPKSVVPSHSRVKVV
jgi:hypothetical protein